MTRAEFAQPELSPADLYAVHRFARASKLMQDRTDTLLRDLKTHVARVDAMTYDPDLSRWRSSARYWWSQLPEHVQRSIMRP